MGLDMLKRICIIMVLISGVAFADEYTEDTKTEDNEAYYLEDIEVIAKPDTTEYITQEQISLTGADNLWEIMGTVPGVTLTGGTQRNESNFRLRGYDASRVTVYINGVPQAVPYRGDADHGRILTYDLESIEVQKGYSSMLMGANNLGGAVNLRLAKPKKPFEANFGYTVEYDSTLKEQKDVYVGSVGTKQDLFYIKATAASMDQSHFRLSDNFTPRNDYQTGNERNDSEVDDSKITVVAGVTPVPELDASIVYMRQRASKEAPGDVAAVEPTIWDWPKWDRDSVSFNADYTADGYCVKVLAYYDKYDNRLYTERPHGIPSDYDDYAGGLKIQGGYDINTENNLQMSVMWKTENHKSYEDVTDSYEKSVDIEENTWSIGSEYTVKPMDAFTVVLGAGYDMLVPQYYWTASLGKKDVSDYELSAFVYQLGLFYDVSDDHEMHLTFARKAHFPTMSERFSTYFDTVIPNPELTPEYANHYEVGYKGYVWNRLHIVSALYFSDITDKILKESVRDDSTGQTVKHSLNMDAWVYYGFEFSAEYFWNEKLSAGMAFSYNKSRSNYDDVRDTYYPDTTGNAYVVYHPTEHIRIVPRAEYTSERYTTTDPDDPSYLDDYTLLHCSVKIDEIFGHFYIEAAVNNIMDQYYEIREYYPMPGRVYSLSIGGVF